MQNINIPGLDIEQGLAVFAGDTEDYMSAVASFVKNTPDIIDKLRGVTAENLPDYAITVHDLKSISGWICAQNIRDRAAELETLAKSGDVSGVIARNDAFLKDTGAFVQEIQTLLQIRLR